PTYGPELRVAAGEPIVVIPADREPALIRPRWRSSARDLCVLQFDRLPGFCIDEAEAERPHRLHHDPDIPIPGLGHDGVGWCQCAGFGGGPALGEAWWVDVAPTHSRGPHP